METSTETNQFEGLICPTINIWSVLPKTVKLSASARNMLDVFVTYMQAEDNLVLFAEGRMEEWIEFCSIRLQLNYTEKTVRNAISELNKAELLLRARKDIYYINPRYFFKWHDKLDHRKLIASIQDRTGVNLWNEDLKQFHIKKKEDQNIPENNDD
jgi:hypothetical protein